MFTVATILEVCRGKLGATWLHLPELKSLKLNFFGIQDFDSSISWYLMRIRKIHIFLIIFAHMANEMGGPILYIIIYSICLYISITSDLKYCHFFHDIRRFKLQIPFFTSSKYDFRQFPTLYLTFLLQKTAKNGTFFTSKIAV